MDYSKFIGLLKKIKYNIISDNVSIIELCDNNQDIEYIKQAILFDNTNMCFYGSNYRDDYQSFIDDFSNYIASSSINYAVFYQEKFIGLFMAWYHDYEKDKKRFAIGYVIDEKYRNCGIGAYAFEKFLEIIINEYDVDSIHACTRNDNEASKKLLKKFLFHRYKGYREDDFFIDKDNKKIPQLQYLLKKKDYLKKVFN